MSGIIYYIQSPSGKGYVGKTDNFEERMKGHQKISTKCTLLKRAINEVFKVESDNIIEIGNLKICHIMNNLWLMHMIRLVQMATIAQPEGKKIKLYQMK